MRRFLILVLAAGAVAFALPAGAKPGVLDRLFGGNGIVTAFPDGAIATAVGIDGERRITAVGYTVDARADVVVARFLPDGTPDPAFGSNGRARFDLGGIDDAFDVAVTPVGGLAIVGRRTAGQDRMFVLRIRPNGMRDPGFGHRGVKLVDFGKPRQSAGAVAFTPQGRIVIGGYTSNGVLVRSAFARLSASGALDRGFGGDGRVSFELGSGSEQINDLLVLPGGGVVAAGEAENAQDPRFTLVKLTGGGRLDTSFGVGRDGVSVLDVEKGPDVANALTIAANGDYLLAGSAGVDGDWAVVATDPTGIPDPAYGNNGRVVLRFARAFEEATDIVASGARALVVGRIHGTGDDVGVVRLKAGGGLDTTFSGDGIVRIDVSGTTDAAAAAALQANGKLVVAGQTWRGGVPRFVLARILDN
ncbi:MAG: hypothetical protein ABJB55_02965 [Actinomycetota bacterium]